MNPLQTVSIDNAVAVVIAAARNYPNLLRAEFDDVARRDTEGMRALLKVVHLETCSNGSPAAHSGTHFPVVVGQPITDEGIPWGKLRSGDKTIRLYLIPDYVRDASGRPLELNAEQAVDMVTSFNGGFKYGSGFEKDVKAAVADGDFKEGTIILARSFDLLELSEQRKYTLGLGDLNTVVQTDAVHNSRCVSGTQHPSDPALVDHINIRNGWNNWLGKDVCSSRVILLRGFNCG